MGEKITNEGLTTIIQWLAQRTNATCPFCGGHEWTVDDELTALPTLQHDAPHLQTERGHSLVLVTCDQCGFTASFAAKRLRVE
jgi:predicted nucleic-acid-binding Zn-ribbon protein